MVDGGLVSAKFIFKLKLFTASVLKMEDPKIVDMMFIQCVHSILSGQYPCTSDEAVHLGALQFQSKFGDHNPETHKPGFLSSKIIEYIPGMHLSGAGITIARWEEAIFEQHRKLISRKPKESYIGLIRQRDYVGCELFAAKQYFDSSMPKRVFIGISKQGILFLKMPASYVTGRMETLAKFALGDIYRWAYKPGETFYFEVKATAGQEENPEYRFKTPEGKDMSDLLTDYAMALLREMGLNPDGTKRERRIPPKKAALSGASADAFKGVGGDAGNLAIAATKSGAKKSKSKGKKAKKPSKKAKDPPPAPSMPPPPPPPDTEESEEEEESESEEEEEEEEEEEAAEEADEDDEDEDDDEGPLPANWTKEYDEGSESYYFFNTETGESLWERPTE